MQPGGTGAGAAAGYVAAARPDRAVRREEEGSLRTPGQSGQVALDTGNHRSGRVSLRSCQRIGADPSAVGVSAVTEVRIAAPAWPPSTLRVNPGARIRSAAKIP